MDTNSTTINPNTAMVSSLLDTIVNAIADSVMQKVAARLRTIEDDLHEVIKAFDERVVAVEKRPSAEPGADYVTLATRIATIEANVKAVGEKLDTVEGTVDEHQNTLDDFPSSDDLLTEDRVSDIVADALPDMDEFVKTEDIAQAIEDNLPDDLVRQQALEDAVGTAVSKLRIVIGD